MLTVLEKQMKRTLDKQNLPISEDVSWIQTAVRNEVEM